MSRPVNITDSVVVNFEQINTSSSSYNTGSNTANAYTPVTDDTYANYTLKTGANAQTYVTFDFSTVAIPINASINSISARVRAYTTTTQNNRIASATAQLRTGTTLKGSSISIKNSTANVQTMTAGSWTASELANANMYFVATRSTNNTNTTYSMRIYGGELTVNYSLSTTAYTIATSATASGVTITPTSHEVYAGEDSQEIRIDCNDISEYSITDNDVDISNSLIRHEVVTSDTISSVPLTYTTSISNGSFTNSSYFAYPVNYSAENPHTGGSAIYTSTRGLTGYAQYTFDFSDIPANATISSVEVKCYGFAETTSTYTYSAANIDLYSGNTQKSTTQHFTSTNSQTITISNPGTWTRAELQNARLRFTVGRYGGYLGGVTWKVAYTIPSDNQYYWTYAISNVSADHLILVSDTQPYIPPEEDPEETYWPVTISSINALTNPPNGTLRVVEGSNETIIISPTDPQLTLALDNGVDITSQLSGGIPTNTYSITTQVSGASYGFNLNSNTGYYTSTNDGVGSSASVARVNFDLESSVLVTIQYINQGESQADYGLFGKIDTVVSTNGLTYSGSSASPDDPNNYYYMCAAASDSSTAVKTLTYEISAGQHFIDIKYGKDQASDSGYDSLQWKILSVEATGPGGDYTYTLTNITQKHSLIFVFGDVTFYYITSSSTSGARLFPDGQQVKLEGDSYKLNIVPDNINSQVSLTDNGVNVTNQLEELTGVDKNNNPVVSYAYILTNIQANHTLIVTIGAATSQIYLKENGIWTPYTKVYKKINGSWVEQSDLSSVFNTSANYIKAN